MTSETTANETATAGKPHFPGLDSLRFLAAFFVVLDHIPMNQGSAGLPNPSYGALFFRGEPAVAFFFTLSGFLITYLLLEERRRTGEVRVGSFYLRRACRIWPLYFLIVILGLSFYNFLLPRLSIHYPVEYDLRVAVLFYVLLLPNVMNGLYRVGGILNPLWSIGVEEQFYLFWAPALRRLRDALPGFCWGLLGTSFAAFCLNHAGVFGGGSVHMIAGQLRFHFMAAGALCAWALQRHRERLLALLPFSSRPLQYLLAALLLEYYLAGLIPWGWFLEEILQVVLYSWLIVTVAANPRNVVRVSNPACEYLGTISYGLYMWHMVAIYGTSALFRATSWWRGHLALYCIAYYGIAFGATVLISHLSYRWLERPFLRLKDRRYSPVSALAPLGATHASAASALPSRPDPGSGTAAPAPFPAGPLARSLDQRVAPGIAGADGAGG
ncbi:MAG TPA: acyltransferase [Thermoanaerobaculia bacterium]|jgi:peptidoglycan/LPS O-acetylase OafA/YrhL|nr:acyltransferase [Thermoanaerobaculia bacterium]